MGLINWTDTNSSVISMEAMDDGAGGDYDTGVAGFEEDAEAVDAVTVDPGVATNNTQIFKESYGESFRKISTYSNDPTKIRNSLAIQERLAISRGMGRISGRILTGVKSAKTTDGLFTAVATNVIEAAGAALDVDLVEAMVAMAASNGVLSNFGQKILLCGVAQKSAINSAYKVQPASFVRGGVTLDTIMTAFGEFPVFWDAQAPTDALGLVNLDACALEFIPMEGAKLYRRRLPDTKSQVRFEIYADCGLNYGYETMHCQISGLAV
jgi:hypothetical protein